MKYDVIIIGGGPAGLTAGLYGARAGMNIGIISKNIGGTGNIIHKIDNWPGFSGSGKELMKKFYDQVKKYNVDFIKENVIDIKKRGEKFVVKTNSKSFDCKAVILSVGTEKCSKINGENKFLGKGVSYCVTCDGFFYKNKIVGIVEDECEGESIRELAGLAKKVYVFCEKDIDCEKLKEIKKEKNIEIVCNVVIKEIKGENKIESVVLIAGGEEKEIKLDGFFIENRCIALTDLAKDLKLEMSREAYIKVDNEMKTSATGVFAAGDCTNSKLKQVLVASAQGSIAAKSAVEYVNE